MLNDKLKGAIAGALTMAVIGCGTGLAKEASESITAVYQDIKLVIDGVLIEPKDVDGNTVEPFIYNGTTYLPVRSVAQAFGKEVSWDGVEKVVYLGAKPGNVENWLDVCGPYQYKGGTEYKLEDNKYFTMSGKKYTNGYTLYLWNPARHTEALYNLDGRFDNLSFTVGHIDGTTNADVRLNIYLDDIIAYTKELHYDDVAQKVSVPLNGALQMKIEIECDEPLNTYDIYYGFSEGVFE